MYNEYKEHYSNINTQPVSESMYRQVFDFDFNLHFHQPHKDTCVKCDIFKMKSSICESEQEKNYIETSKSLNLRKTQLAREKLREAGDLSKSNPYVHAFTFYLQKALPYTNVLVSVL